MRFVRVRLPAALVGIGLALTMCGKKSDPPQGQAVQSLAVSSAEPASASWRYVIEPAGTTHIDMPGVAERITADTSASQGAIDLVPGDLGKSRGSVKIDLTTLKTTTFGSDKDQLQTKHARTWLEVQVGDTTHEDMRYAVYAIRSVDTSLPSLSAVPVERSGAEDLRRAGLVLHGDLLIHGHEVPKDVAITAVFHYPAGAPQDSRPVRIELETRDPMRVVLKEHDVRPRDPVGQIVAWSTSLVSKVAETADVTVHLSAVPAG